MSRTLESVQEKILQKRSFDDLKMQAAILSSLAKAIIRDLEKAFNQACDLNAA